MQGRGVAGLKMRTKNFKVLILKTIENCENCLSEENEPVLLSTKQVMLISRSQTCIIPTLVPVSVTFDATRLA